MFLSNCKSLDQSEILYVLSDEAPIDIGPYQNGLAHKEIYMLQWSADVRGLQIGD